MSAKSRSFSRAITGSSWFRSETAKNCRAAVSIATRLKRFGRELSKHGSLQHRLQSFARVANNGSSLGERAAKLSVMARKLACWNARSHYGFNVDSHRTSCHQLRDTRRNTLRPTARIALRVSPHQGAMIGETASFLNCSDRY